MNAMYFKIYGKDHALEIISMLFSLGFEWNQFGMKTDPNMVRYIYTDSKKTMTALESKIVCKDVRPQKSTLDDLYRMKYEVREATQIQPLLTGYQAFEIPGDGTITAVSNIYGTRTEVFQWMQQHSTKNTMIIKKCYYR